MKKINPAISIEPTEVISSVFTTQRDLTHGVKAVVGGSGFSLEEADLLVSLYGVRVLDWEDLPHDQEGFVTFHHLERYLVHNPSLVSRRISKFSRPQARPALVEVRRVDPASGLHFNAKRVKITEEGIRRVEPVWKRYQQLSANLVKDIPADLLRAHQRVNQEISKRIRLRRDGLTDLFVEDP